MGYGSVDWQNWQNKHTSPQWRFASRSVKQRWETLTAVGLISAMNASLCMTFSAVKHEASEALQINDVVVARLYTVWLMTAMFVLVPGSWLAERYEKASVWASTLLTVFSAWQRWMLLADVKPRGGHDVTFWCILSQVLCGIASFPLFTLPGQISHRRFPAEQRPLATSLLLQASTFGWLIGVTVPPLLVNNTVSFHKMNLLMAISYSAVGLFALLLYQSEEDGLPFKEKRQSASVEDLHTHARSGTNGFLMVYNAARDSPSFGGQMVANGIIGGVGTAAPSSICFILDGAESIAAAANLVFILAGIVGGVLLGFVCKDSSSFEPTLKTSYVFCAIALLASAILADDPDLTRDPNKVNALIALCAVAGGCSLGSVGISMEACSLYPVNVSYVCWGIQSLVLLFGALLADSSADRSGFLELALAAAVSAILILGVYQRPTQRIPEPPPHLATES